MRRMLIVLALFVAVGVFAQDAKPAGHYLFAWAGDADHKANDFLAVVDADPSSPDYGHLITTVATD